jgi:formylglycine-generating enzyme required for sulfatase activity
MRRCIFVAAACLGSLTCASPGERTAAESASASAHASAAATGFAPAVASVVPAPGPSVSALAPGEAAPPGRTEGCPEGMVRVEGSYCPNVEQVCVEHHEEYEKDAKKKSRAKARGEAHKSTVSERCLRYEEPSKCLSSNKRPMRFCIDRYEFPNRRGELPALLVSWTEAKKTCASLGKRLCTEDEFNFACEGEAMLPYTYGYIRDPQKCSIDRPYRKRERKLHRYDKCMRTPACKEHLAELDQRLPAGSLPQCVSPFGVYDMNGNINEWVEMPGEEYPDRSGLKGGWWGPVRGRCRPTVTFHKEDDYGYEEGFRCCADLVP